MRRCLDAWLESKKDVLFDFHRHGEKVDLAKGSGGSSDTNLGESLVAHYSDHVSLRSRFPGPGCFRHLPHYELGDDSSNGSDAEYGE